MFTVFFHSYLITCQNETENEYTIQYRTLVPYRDKGGLEEVMVHCFHLQMLPHVAYLLHT
jgi:hypothetical protein